MLSVTIVCLKILTGTFCNCLSYKMVLIMERGKELSNSQKALIVKLWKDGESYKNILSNLNIPFSTSSFIARFKRRNTVENKKRTGPPRMISTRLSRKLGRLIKQNPIVMREELQEDLRSSGWSVTKPTISNEMLRNGLKSRKPKKTPLLLKRHRDARLKFIRQPKEKENSFWGCFSMKGVGKISVIDGKTDAQKYKQILQENLMSSVESLELPSDYIFQQYNNSKHAAKSTKKWLSEDNVNVLQWPS